MAGSSSAIPNTDLSGYLKGKNTLMMERAEILFLIS
jgi:hypothetical protein